MFFMTTTGLIYRFCIIGILRGVVIQRAFHFMRGGDSAWITLIIHRYDLRILICPHYTTFHREKSSKPSETRRNVEVSK